ncbi:TPA: phage repressor protein CI [Klebsiella pneumoniae]|nr:helix-turn-helix domain-containing protein [Klebsiella pneumoniae]HCE8971574.1 phage repressor protein CI [Klebsiella pneumoniae]HCG2944185.1 phage repressor protein CI [Klebsiella pneumoniae]HCH7877250.1 phage repressor protein CI [Klebsiella pneumoniae]
MLGAILTVSSEHVRVVLERILTSYGVKTRQAYADLLGMPIGTINNWLKRGNIPGDYLVRCVLDTGVDLRWLKDGELTNVSFSNGGNYVLKGQELIKRMQESGGKIVLRRIMDAYGFTLQKQLGDLLDIPSGTMSAWVRREHFPGDIVIVCALDTGVSLYWLATGNGSMYEQKVEGAAALPVGLKKIAKYSIHTGQMVEAGLWFCDESLIDPSVTNPVLTEKNGHRWLVDLDAKNIANGRWLISIDGAMDVFDVIRLPGNKARLSNNSAEFECSLSDITPSGVVICTIEKHI